MAALPSLLALRRDPRLLKAPPYLSALLVVVGFVWLLLLPLNEYSRSTYISENALLPGQVHTYFGGSEQNVFNAYREEVEPVMVWPPIASSKILNILQTTGLKTATQNYKYDVGGQEYGGQNVYGILHAPRGDATEAIVLVAALRNMEDETNASGVALALTLARYFKRWSLWSKDIIFLFPSDSKAGTQAWVEAYHDSHHPQEVEPLPLKSGALEGAVVIDNPLNHSFETIHISYDGINGQLTNLDLFNTAVSIATGQHGIGASLQKMWKHDNKYQDRLRTMLRGMANQGLGYASGPHSSFIPYHVDAITLKAIGAGREDNMAFGRVVESLFRSLNNLMEHFHQSFFLYLLMHTHRFVSIGTYLPSAMLVAANFTIMAIALWIVSGRPPKTKPLSGKGQKGKEKAEMEVVTHGSDVALIPKQELAIEERHVFLPFVSITALHFLGVLPLFLFNRLPLQLLTPALYIFTPLNAVLPLLLQPLLRTFTRQQLVLLKCFSLLLLGMFLATLATINFSLSFMVGLLAAPLTYAGVSSAEPDSQDAPIVPSIPLSILQNVVLHLMSPPVVFIITCTIVGADAGVVLAEAAFGWRVWGLWTQVIVWCVWWPAWMAGAASIVPALF